MYKKTCDNIKNSSKGLLNSPQKKSFKKITSILLILAYLICFTSINVSKVQASTAAQTEYTEGLKTAALNPTTDEILEEAKAMLKNYYLRTPSEEVLNSKSIGEMLKKLGDPYSSYFTKEEFDEFVNNIDNKFTGIGVRFMLHEEGFEITHVLDSSPAKEAGLQVGDIMLKADNNILKDIKEEQVASYIKGVEGSTVKLLIKREDVLKEYTLVRKALSLPTVEYEELPKHIGYIKISTFGESTGDEFTEALKDLKNKKVQSYIVDLRYNTGGYINPALDIGGHFVGFKPMIQMENNKGYRYKYYGTGYQDLIKEPSIFLTNDYSASASEILSGAMKDYKKASFIGENTYGKGVAQSMYFLKDGSVLKLTTNEFFSPLGKAINHVGVKPDLAVNEENIDSLQIAELLLSNVENRSNIEALKDKNGYVKVILNGISHYINLTEARKDENWESYNNIIQGTEKKAIYLGVGDKWISFADKNLITSIESFYPESKVLKDTLKKKDDKIITITFNNPLVKESINDNIVELINSETGEKVSATLNLLNKNQITVKPKKDLEPGKNYYLVIHKDIKSEKGNNMNKDVVGNIVIGH